MAGFLIIWAEASGFMLTQFANTAPSPLRRHAVKPSWGTPLFWKQFLQHEVQKSNLIPRLWYRCTLSQGGRRDKYLKKVNHGRKRLLGLRAPASIDTISFICLREGAGGSSSGFQRPTPEVLPPIRAFARMRVNLRDTSLMVRCRCAGTSCYLNL